MKKSKLYHKNIEYLGSEPSVWCDELFNSIDLSTVNIDGVPFYTWYDNVDIHNTFIVKNPVAFISYSEKSDVDEKRIEHMYII